MPDMESAARTARAPLEVNGRMLHWPKRPTVVICLDGGDPSYLEASRAAGVVPTLDRMMREGFATAAAAAMPTFTNPNNVSIVCGVPPRRRSRRDPCRAPCAACPWR